MSIAGATRFLNAATLANLQGRAAVSPTILGESSGTLGLLSVGRGIAGNNGIGLSASSRALTNQFLSQSQSGFNTIFSLNNVEFGTPETLSQKILAIRASLPESAIAESLRGQDVDVEA